jgi:hypothetical protein
LAQPPAWSTTKLLNQKIHKFDILSLVCKASCYSAAYINYSSNSDPTNMAPNFDTLSDHDLQEDEEEINFSDLREQYDVRMEEGLDTFVVCLGNEGLPHLTDH